MSDCDDLGGFEQILRGRGALAASLQAPGDLDLSRSSTGEAVAFADVALLQAGVAVQSQALGFDGEAQAFATEATAARSASTAAKTLAQDIATDSFALANSLGPASGAAAADARLADNLSLRPGQLRLGAAIAVIAGRTATVAQPGLVAGALELPATASLAARSNPAGAPRTFQRPLPNLPVVVNLNAEAGEAALAVRADGMSEADQSEFERRTREELALSGRHLRQLKINGRERPVTGVV
ncbi:MAG: hypothetical protein C0515_01260 [Novosphingobium sp.]|nr:hypothetical protein [Novosphingobium sp.]